MGQLAALQQEREQVQIFVALQKLLNDLFLSGWYFQVKSAYSSLQLNNQMLTTSVAQSESQLALLKQQADLYSS